MHSPWRGLCAVSAEPETASISGFVSEGEEHWERFARNDPEFYVAAQRSEWTQAAFYANGAEILAQYKGWIDPLGTERAVEIGSGLGRITVHLAERFNHVHASDISSEMMRRAQERDLPDNISWTVTKGRLPADDRTADLVFSYNVMQHIPARPEVDAYLREIHRVLKLDGRAIVQYDSASRPLWQRLAQTLPDRLLPRTQRRFIRRYSIPAEELTSMIRWAELEIVDERGRSTREHDVLLKRARLGRGHALPDQVPPAPTGINRKLFAR